MKILLMSDSHSHIDEHILEYVQTVDEVWHAGDIGDISVCDQIAKHKKLRAVYGNIDDAKIRSEYPLHNRFVVDGLDVWITHIGGYPGAYAREVRDEIKSNSPKLFISGHSHILKVMYDSKLELMHMNPGAIGLKGFHKKRTMLRFEINKGELQNLEVIEISK